ncbi:YoaK family protein [Embleya sp. NPDC020886]|uniref:YoaK family protein n=1 Tax=Embleya sp. NPDC020886 TaxID=3363980 RepID=UPI0037B56428
MRETLREAKDTLVPPREVGPLPPLLIVLTVVTGLVDALSYLELGRVFVANMTGNVVFTGFALAGTPGLSVAASMAALAAFLVGAAAGGRLGAAFGDRKLLLLRVGCTLQAVLIAAALVVAAAVSGLGTGERYTLILLLGLAMGLQNAVARRLAVPDLTTTVLSQTLTGLAADLRRFGGPGSRAGRRLLAAVAMALGAFSGATLVLQVHVLIAFAAPLVLLVGVAGCAYRLDRPTRAAGVRDEVARPPHPDADPGPVGPPDGPPDGKSV